MQAVGHTEYCNHGRAVLCNRDTGQQDVVRMEGAAPHVHAGGGKHRVGPSGLDSSPGGGHGAVHAGRVLSRRAHHVRRGALAIYALSPRPATTLLLTPAFVVMACSEPCSSRCTVWMNTVYSVGHQMSELEAWIILLRLGRPVPHLSLVATRLFYNTTQQSTLALA